MTRVQVNPALLRWARDRSRLDDVAVGVRFPDLGRWLEGAKQPTFRQLETFAKATRTPIGFLFLPEPPVEEVPIPDMRTRGNRPVEAPSPYLLDTIYQCQQRQDWYREFVQWVGDAACSFVGSVKLSDDTVEVASRMRRELGLDLAERKNLPTWTEALRRMVEQADAAGVLVMVSGVVGSDNHRKLDPDEFRGFALADQLAPLVFVNGADTKAAQMFTLAHELVHVWLGATALSSVDMATPAAGDMERFCDQVAAELLVPLAAVAEEFDRQAHLGAEVERLARHFKVSALVVLRRLRDAKEITQDAYWTAYRNEVSRLGRRTAEGGNFYATLGARTSKRFARAVVVSTIEGRSPFSEAFRLLGFRKLSTFDRLGRSLGVFE